VEGDLRRKGGPDADLDAVGLVSQTAISSVQGSTVRVRVSECVCV
jgi:hypothetical protein